MKITYKIVAVLAGAILLIAIVVLSFWAFMQIDEAAEGRKHTYLILNRAENLLSELKDAETGQRGYLLTGDEAFLEPYLEVRDGIRDHLEELRQLTSISAALKHLDTLTPLIDAKLVELSQVIELHRNHETTAAIAMVSSGQGKRLMDSIRAEQNSYSQLEESALVRHEADFQSDMRRLLIVIVTTSLFLLLFAISSVYFINRETQHQLTNLVHLKTQQLLKMQEDTNKQLQQANVNLQVSEEKLAVTLYSIGDAVMAADAEGHVTLLNPLAEQLTGWTQAEAAGRPVDEIFRIINQETRHPSTIPVKEVLAQGTIRGLPDRTILIARDGSECAIADSCAPIRNHDNQVVGVVLVFRDITERMAIETGLEKTRKELEVIKISQDEAREYAESLINTVREPLIALDQDLRVVKVSRSFYDFFKVKPEDTVGQLIYDLGNKQWDIPKLRELLETILPEKASFDNYEVEHDFAGVGRRTMLLNARQIKRVIGKERIILLAIEDITDSKASEDEIHSLAFYDPLTNLPNRRLLNDRLTQMMAARKRSGRYAALMFLDLDNFKSLNDTQGHNVGDLLLIEVARRISRCVREMDTIARFGGDEFVAILGELDTDQAKAITQAKIVAEKIRITLAEPYILTFEQDSGARIIEHHCTASIGVVLFNNHEISGEEILKRADMTMYQAKEGGRNQSRFFDVNT